MGRGQSRGVERLTTCRSAWSIRSTGYDSPAAAVIARQAGCRKAVTLTTSRGGEADSGAEIAAMLGLPCREFPRFATGVEQRGKRDYVVGDSSVSTDILRRFDDFLSSIVTPEDAVFAAFEPLLRNAIFFQRLVRRCDLGDWR